MIVKVKLFPVACRIICFSKTYHLNLCRCRVSVNPIDCILGVNPVNPVHPFIFVFNVSCFHPDGKHRRTAVKVCNVQSGPGSEVGERWRQ